MAVEELLTKVFYGIMIYGLAIGLVLSGLSLSIDRYKRRNK